MVYCKEIEDYIKYVEENPEETDIEIKLLIKNVVKPTLERDDIFFDNNMFKNFITFTEKWFYKLYPYQKFLSAFVFMYDKNDMDIVVFPEIFLLMARGNGKDGLIAPLALFLISPIYGVQKYNVDIVATSEEQAKGTFDVCYEMLESNKIKMKKYFYWNKEYIICRKTYSKLKYNTSGFKTKDGKAPGLIIFNEYHAYETSKEINVHTSGLGKVKHARIIIITTDGTVREGPLDEKKDLSNRVLNGEYNFTGILPIIYRLNDRKLVEVPMQKYLETQNKDDIDFTYWIRANPSLPFRSVLKNQIIKDFFKMKEEPSYKIEFYTKRMNLPEKNQDEIAVSWENIEKASYSNVEKKIPRETPKLEGKKAIIGFDLASLNDFMSAILIFKINDEYIWRGKTWICASNENFKGIKFPFNLKGEEGFRDFEITYEKTLDEKELVKWCIEQMKEYDIVKIIGDMYRFKLLKKAFSEEGLGDDYIETPKNPDGLIRMIRNLPSVEAIIIPKIENEFIKENINIGNSAMMRWAINNTYTKTKKDGNKTYEKIEPKLRKNDPFMAAMCGMTGHELLDENTEVIYV